MSTMNTEITRDLLIDRIRAIEENQKLKQEAFFFCGFPSDMPNESMQKACRNYLRAVDGGNGAADEKEALISAFEDEVRGTEAGRPAVTYKNMFCEAEEIHLVLENRALL